LLKESLSDERWEARVKRAFERLGVVESLLSKAGAGPVTRKHVRQSEPPLKWPTFRNWQRWYRTREGPVWERMLDRRLPRGKDTPEWLRGTVRTLARQEPPPTLAKIRELLVEEYGEKARRSDNTLRGILAEAGLRAAKEVGEETEKKSDVLEKVTELSGGGGLVLLSAADAMTGATRQLAEAVQNVAGEQQVRELRERAEDGYRDDRGRFTGKYNEVRKVDAERRLVNPVYQSVRYRRRDRDLNAVGVEVLECRRCDVGCARSGLGEVERALVRAPGIGGGVC